jgi:hypothetical protein
MDKTSTENRKWNQSSSRQFGSVEATANPRLSTDSQPNLNVWRQLEIIGTPQPYLESQLMT